MIPHTARFFSWLYLEHLFWFAVCSVLDDTPFHSLLMRAATTMYENITTFLVTAEERKERRKDKIGVLNSGTLDMALHGEALER